MINTTLSDLFFNYQHKNPPRKTRVTGSTRPTDNPIDWEDWKIQVLQEATEFLEMYRSILSCNIPKAEDLSEDFFVRI